MTFLKTKEQRNDKNSYDMTFIKIFFKNNTSQRNDKNSYDINKTTIGVTITIRMRFIKNTPLPNDGNFYDIHYKKLNNFFRNYDNSQP